MGSNRIYFYTGLGLSYGKDIFFDGLVDRRRNLSYELSMKILCCCLFFYLAVDDSLVAKK